MYICKFPKFNWVTTRSPLLGVRKVWNLTWLIDPLFQFFLISWRNMVYNVRKIIFSQRTGDNSKVIQYLLFSSNRAIKNRYTFFCNILKPNAGTNFLIEFAFRSKQINSRRQIQISIPEKNIIWTTQPFYSNCGESIICKIVMFEQWPSMLNQWK